MIKALLMILVAGMPLLIILALLGFWFGFLGTFGIGVGESLYYHTFAWKWLISSVALLIGFIFTATLGYNMTRG